MDEEDNFIVTNQTEPTVIAEKWPPVGIVPTFVVIMGMKALFGLIGIVLNLDLVYVTIRNRSLHHTCNWLIAMASLGSAIYQLGTFPSLAVFLNGRNVVKQDVCFRMQALPLFGKTFSLAIMLAIGLDRLRAVLFIGCRIDVPAKKLLYCLCWAAVASAISLYILVISYLDCSPKRSVECSFTSHIAQGPSTDIVFDITLWMNLASPAIYLLLGIILAFKRKDSSASWTRRVFKSIFVMMVIETVGWGSNSLYVWMQHTNNVPDALNALIRQSRWFAWISNKLYSYIISFALVANVPALYLCSTDYQTAFRSHFRNIQQFLCFGRSQGSRRGSTVFVTPYTMNKWTAAVVGTQQQRSYQSTSL